MIRILVYPLFILTLFGAIRARQLDLTLISPQFFSVIAILTLVGIVSFFFRDRIKLLFFQFYRVGVMHFKFFVGISIFLIGVLQVIILLNTQTPIGWDVGDVMKAIVDPKNGVEYASINPNNLFLISVYHIIYHAFLPTSGFSAYTWTFFQVLTAIELDISVVAIVIFACKIFNKEVALNTYLLFCFLFILTPYIQTPYSDIAVLLPTSLSLLCFVALETTNNKYFQIILTILIGFFFVIVYEIKPSAVVLLIAWIIDTLFRFLKTDRNRKRLEVCGLVVLLIFSFAIGQKCVNDIIESQTPVHVVKNRALPWQHFVLMGMTGNGGYNSAIRQKTLDYVTTEKMARHSTQEIEKRLKQLNPVGYLQFLVGKQIRNTDRGDFAWGQEGVPQFPFKKTKGILQDRIRSLYLIGGRNQINLSFYYQIVWLITLTGILFSLMKANLDKEKWISVFILGMLGAFLYLLLFEGGRSRYLIQYLPMLLPLAAWGWHSRHGYQLS